MKKQTNKSQGNLKQTQPVHSQQQLSIKSDDNTNNISQTKNHQITSILKINPTIKPTLRLQNYQFEEQQESQHHIGHIQNPQSASPRQKRNKTIRGQQNVIKQFSWREQINCNQFQCILCCQIFELESFHRIFQCTHFYCKGCLQQYCKTCVNAFKILKCPDGDCQKAMTKKGKEFLNFNPLIKEKYEIVKFRIKVQNNPSLILCPNQSCKKGSIAVKKGQKNGLCFECNKAYCIKCKAPSHTGNCSDFEEIILKDKFKYKRCSGCGFVVQRSSGCPHMTCKCGSQFCYYCASPWSPSHYCIRVAAGGDLVTEKIYDKLSCIRSKELEYEYTFVGYLSKIPTFLLCFCFMVFYVSWSLFVLACHIVGCILISILLGYVVIMIQVFSKSKVLFVLGIIFLPIAFVICFSCYAYETIKEDIQVYLLHALSGQLFAFCF